MRAWHPALVLASLVDRRVADLRRFLLLSGGVCEWMGEGSAPRWMRSALQSSYTFSEVWDGVLAGSALPSEAQHHAMLASQVRVWRSSLERWRVHVPDGRAEASPEQLARWKEGLSALFARVLRAVYRCLRAGYGVWQWARAVSRVIQLRTKVK